MTTVYKVEINRTDPTAKRLGSIFLIIAFFGFWIFYFIEPLIRVLTYDIIPSNVSYGFLTIILFGILSLILIGIKRNKKGLLKINSDRVEIEYNPNPCIIYYKDLKRISFIVATFTLKPYRIEFIYPDYKLIRVKLRTKEDFQTIMDYLYNVTPENLEKNVSAFESEEK